VLGGAVTGCRVENPSTVSFTTRLLRQDHGFCRRKRARSAPRTVFATFRPGRLCKDTLRDMGACMDFRGRTTLVTGASSGLGREMARVIAEQYGGNLVIVARRADRLEQLAEELRRRCGVEVRPVAADLSQPSGLDTCIAEATSHGPIDAAILNAGVTFFGRALDQTEANLTQMIATNTTAVAGLATRFARHFIAEGTRGGLLLVSSMASFAPFPYQAAYGATKAFVTSFGLALREELKDDHIPVTVFCPGGIATEMLELSGLSEKFHPGDVGVMDAVTCARYAIEAFRNEADLSVPGPSNLVTSFAMKAFPRSLVAKAVRKIYEGGRKKA